MLALRKEQIPEPLFARLGLQLLDDGVDLPRTEIFRLAIVAFLIRIDVTVHERPNAVLQFDDLLALLIEHIEFHSSLRARSAGRRPRYFFFMPGSVPIILHSTISITSSAP